MKRRTWITAISATICLVAVASGLSIWFFVVRPDQVKARADKPKKMLFVSIRPVVVNVHSKGQFGLSTGPTYLQIGFELATTDAKALSIFKSIQPAIRGNVLDVLLNASPDVLDKQVARNKLRARVLALVNGMLAQHAKKGAHHAFSSVYITRFVTQPG